MLMIGAGLTLGGGGTDGRGGRTDARGRRAGSRPPGRKAIWAWAGPARPGPEMGIVASNEPWPRGRASCPGAGVPTLRGPWNAEWSWEASQGRYKSRRA